VTIRAMTPHDKAQLRRLYALRHGLAEQCTAIFTRANRGAWIILRLVWFCVVFFAFLQVDARPRCKVQILHIPCYTVQGKLVCPAYQKVEVCK
jgi:hypothetical protein